MPPQPNPLADIHSDDGSICLGDFYAVPGMNQYMYMPTRELWPKESVDRILPPVPLDYKHNGHWVTLKPSVWLTRYRRVEQITWAPELPEIIKDQLIFDGGWRAHPGARALNLYLPPTLVHGDATKAGPWIEHLNTLYPEDAEDITNWCAHRVQYPGTKINHSLMMGGSAGIGKDFLLEALKIAVGPWNFQEISPTDLLAPYNPFVRAVVIRVNEVHDLGDSGRFDRYALYERVKIYAAAPPDVLACVDKYIRRFYVPNVHGLVITTNHKTDGIYLPSDDRRHLVAWSDCTKEDFESDKEFWNERWHWLRHDGGAGHVAAYLAQRDLSAFDPCALPRQTPAFAEIVSANQAPEDAELADALDEMGNEQGRPDICSLATIVKTQCGAGLDWLLDRRRRRSIPHRLERCGYVAVRNPKAGDGLWVINKRRQTLYAKTTLTPKERLKAAYDYVMREMVGNS